MSEIIQPCIKNYLSFFVEPERATEITESLVSGYKTEYENKWQFAPNSYTGLVVPIICALPLCFKFVRTLVGSYALAVSVMRIYETPHVKRVQSFIQNILQGVGVLDKVENSSVLADNVRQPSDDDVPRNQKNANPPIESDRLRTVVKASIALINSMMQSIKNRMTQIDVLENNPIIKNGLVYSMIALPLCCSHLLYNLATKVSLMSLVAYVAIRIDRSIQEKPVVETREPVADPLRPPSPSE